MFASTDRNKVAQPPLWSGSDVPSLVLRHLNGAGVTATRWRGQRSGVAAAGSLRSAHAEVWRGCGRVSPHAPEHPDGLAECGKELSRGSALIVQPGRSWKQLLQVPVANERSNTLGVISLLALEAVP